MGKDLSGRTKAEETVHTLYLLMRRILAILVKDSQVFVILNIWELHEIIVFGGGHKALEIFDWSEGDIC
jgi:hypothetical protein